MTNIMLEPGEEELGKVLGRLCDRFNVDFSRYRSSTIARRVGRRMMSCGLDQVDQYCTRLDEDPKEQVALFHDLLISVTEFFRDPGSFRYLEEEVIPKLIKERPGRDMRIWCAGCSTGEEAYSLAIIMTEATERCGYDGDVSIFATDIHRRSLEQASEGIFEKDRLRNVSPERMERFFRPSGRQCRITDDIREKVVFAPQNLISDLPLFRNDLITCRNVLIYLRPEVQERILASFHLGLVDGGYLFLGSSESIGGPDIGLETANRTHRVFRKNKEGRSHELMDRLGKNKSGLDHSRSSLSDTWQAIP